MEETLSLTLRDFFGIFYVMPQKALIAAAIVVLILGCQNYLPEKFST